MAHRGVEPGLNRGRMGKDLSIILSSSTPSSCPKESRQRGQRGNYPQQVLWAAFAAGRSPTIRPLAAEEPLEAPRSAACFPFAPLGDPSVVLFLGPGRRLLAEEPPVAPLGVLFGG